MSARGVHFALSADQLAKLESCKNQEAILDYITETLEGAWDKEWLAESDKAWDAIHRSLTETSNGQTELIHSIGVSLAEKCSATARRKSHSLFQHLK